APQRDAFNVLQQTVWPGGGGSGEPLSGRITSLAIAQQNGQNVMLVWTAGGRGWSSSGFAGKNPTWNYRPMQFRFGMDTPDPGLGSGSIDVGALAVDPNNPQVIFDGTGEANGSGDSRYGSGIFKSTDGGITWDISPGGNSLSGNPNQPAFFRHSFSKIFVDPT